jgi:integrase
MVWPEDPAAYFFSPARAYAAHLERRRAARATPAYPSHDPARRLQRRRAGGVRPRTLGDRYTVDSYRRAVHRACDAEAALDAARGVEAHLRVRRFGPAQLRHERAGVLADRAGIHVARELLGHQSIATTQIYVAQRVQERSAIRAAARFG